MRLIILAEGPTRLSRLSKAQAVERLTPRTMACLAALSKPAATNAPRISAIFDACLRFAFDGKARGRPMCRCILLFSPLNPRRVEPPTTGTEIVGGFAFDQTERPPRSLRKNSISLGHAADAAACFILLRPSMIKPASPVAKSGRAPGMGITEVPVTSTGPVLPV